MSTQQAYPRKIVGNQETHQVPHGNSSAMAKECVYCIAKRVCIQSCRELTTKTPIGGRFEKLTQHNNCQSPLKFGIGEYQWAQKVKVVIKRALDDAEISTRDVHIDHEVMQMDKNF